MVEFYKFHGLGNDFVLIEGTEATVTTRQVVDICRRHRGVGADGVLLVQLQQPSRSVPRVEMIVFNRDGSRPEMCGNGVRCVAAFAQRQWGLGEEMIVESDAGDRRCRVDAIGDFLWHVTVSMGSAKAVKSDTELEVNGHNFPFFNVDVGNPHAVIFAPASDEQVRQVGVVANDDHPAFPTGVNVEFVQAGAADHEVVARIYERGVGMTRACGTGACAVAQALWTSGRVARDKAVTVELPGGSLSIQRRDDQVWMTGPAQQVFSGHWHQP